MRERRIIEIQGEKIELEIGDIRTEEEKKEINYFCPNHGFFKLLPHSCFGTRNDLLSPPITNK